MRATTNRLDLDIDPIDVGARSGFLWARGDVALAGIGEAVRLPVERPAGGAEAQRALASLGGPDGVDGSVDGGIPGTGAVGFGAFPFDRSRPAELIVPSIVLGRGSEGRRWLTRVDDGAMSIDDAIDRVRSVLDRKVPQDPQPSEFRVASVLGPEVWRDEVVATARDRIRSGALQKAVLARELVLDTDHPIDVALVVERLRQAYRSSILFSIDGFVGASPELLVARHHDIVRAHPLAGTAPRSSDPAADGRLAAGLLASSKDRHEHRITIDWLLDNLLPFCSYVDAEPEPSTVTLANVHHLGTLVEGRLSAPSASVLELVEALHPTPAVGGDPQAVALDLIDELERAERDRYAGPVGWVDSAGNGSFAVAIRSAMIDGASARLFAGVGVVADSDPVAELAETRAKFQAMLTALVRP